MMSITIKLNAEQSKVIDVLSRIKDETPAAIATEALFELARCLLCEPIGEQMGLGAWTSDFKDVFPEVS